MGTMMRKIFSLSEIRFSWLLLLSISVCIGAFYIDEQSNPDNQLALSLAYSFSFALAALWAGANYIGHIRMNSLYRRQNDIGAYVNQLALGSEDKLELQNYLEDFSADLMLKGRTKEAAAQEAINQFKAKEFLSMSKHSKLFETHGHHYLLGYAIISIVMVLIITLINQIVSIPSLLLLIAYTILIVYGFCLGALFIFYRILDKFLYEKLKNYFM